MDPTGPDRFYCTVSDEELVAMVAERNGYVLDEHWIYKVVHDSREGLGGILVMFRKKELDPQC